MKTPKANLRQERINNTRPVLVFKDYQSLNTIPEDTESQYTAQNSIANDTIELFQSSEKVRSNPTVSSEIKSIKNKNKLDEIDDIIKEEDGARTGKNEPNLGNFDIGLENDIGLLKLGSLQSNGLDSLNVLPLDNEADDSPMDSILPAAAAISQTLEPIPETQNYETN